MPRPARRDIIVPGNYYHVYARGNDGMTVFRGTEDYESYLALLREYARAEGVCVHHFTLMPNHIHLILRPDDGTLSGLMKRLQNRYAKAFCKKYAFRGHLWQGRFKCKLLDNDAYLFACGNYIEMNPVRAGLVENPAEWPWSSYRFYALGEQDGSIEPDPMYLSLGDSEEARRSAYRRLIGETRVAG